ncbi:MAG: hypothetical protein JXC32_14005 [Anaerolineae bacterium]|nr:hypothetical protein [Anaerolineae bacterium]
MQHWHVHLAARNGPTYEGRTNGETTYLDASAIWDRDRLHVFAVNRSPTERAEVRVQVADRELVALESGELLTGPDPKAANSYAQPDLVVSRPFAQAQVADGTTTVELPPLSVAALTLRLA